jgi:hypothetical protein
MSPRQVADAGDALQVWRIAVNILNKQSRTADSRRSSSLGLGVGLTTPHRKKKLVMKMLKSLGSGRIPWINDLSERKWI